MNSDTLAETDWTGTLQEEYVFFNGKRIARRDGAGNTVRYYFADHLGSADVITDNVGVVKKTSMYYPFGGKIALTGATFANTYKFTGKERDSESNLDYFGARYYASSLARFMSPDQKLTSGRAPNPQTWNRYSYALNNPTIYIDPNAREAVLFYRSPDPNQRSLKDFGHIFLFVRNDKTGRSGFFDYYPDGKNSAVHRTVDPGRIANHAAVVIPSTPEAEEKMLNKMDELTKKDPAFHATAQEVATRTESDCVSNVDQILGAGGVESESQTPTGLWEDLYSEYSQDESLYSENPLQSQGLLDPQMGHLYGPRGGSPFKTLNDLIDFANEQKGKSDKAKRDTQEE